MRIPRHLLAFHANHGVSPLEGWGFGQGGLFYKHRPILGMGRRYEKLNIKDRVAFKIWMKNYISENNKNPDNPKMSERNLHNYEKHIEKWDREVNNSTLTNSGFFKEKPERMEIPNTPINVPGGARAKTAEEELSEQMKQLKIEKKKRGRPRKTETSEPSETSGEKIFKGKQFKSPSEVESEYYFNYQEPRTEEEAIFLYPTHHIKVPDSSRPLTEEERKKIDEDEFNISSGEVLRGDESSPEENYEDLIEEDEDENHIAIQQNIEEDIQRHNEDLRRQQEQARIIARRNILAEEETERMLADMIRINEEERRGPAIQRIRINEDIPSSEEEEEEEEEVSIPSEEEEILPPKEESSEEEEEELGPSNLERKQAMVLAIEALLDEGDYQQAQRFVFELNKLITKPEHKLYIHPLGKTKIEGYELVQGEIPETTFENIYELYKTQREQQRKEAKEIKKQFKRVYDKTPEDIKNKIKHIKGIKLNKINKDYKDLPEGYHDVEQKSTYVKSKMTADKFEKLMIDKTDKKKTNCWHMIKMLDPELYNKLQEMKGKGKKVVLITGLTSDKKSEGGVGLSDDNAPIDGIIKIMVDGQLYEQINIEFKYYFNYQEPSKGSLTLGEMYPKSEGDFEEYKNSMLKSLLEYYNQIIIINKEIDTEFDEDNIKELKKQKIYIEAYIKYFDDFLNDPISSFYQEKYTEYIPLKFTKTGMSPDAEYNDNNRVNQEQDYKSVKKWLDKPKQQQLIFDKNGEIIDVYQLYTKKSGKKPKTNERYNSIRGRYYIVVGLMDGIVGLNYSELIKNGVINPEDPLETLKIIKSAYGKKKGELPIDHFGLRLTDFIILYGDKDIIDDIEAEIKTDEPKEIFTVYKDMQTPRHRLPKDDKEKKNKAKGKKK